MARGYPDYKVQPTQQTTFNEDNNELAARLGGLSRIHRAGQLIYQTDFSEGITDWLDGCGGGALAEVYNLKSYNGDSVLRLTAANAGLNYAQAYKIFPFAKSYTYGYELTFAVIQGGGGVTPLFTLEILLYNQGTNYRYRVVIDETNHRIRVISDLPLPGGTYDIYTGLYGLASTLGAPVYHWMKLIIDFETYQYTRLLFDDLVIPLTQYTPWLTLAASNYEMYVYLSLASGLLTPMILVDDFILTFNEP